MGARSERNSRGALVCTFRWQTIVRYKNAGEWETGYATQMSTRPQTLGYALTDSPAGLCAWLVEKLHKLENGARELQQTSTDNSNAVETMADYWMRMLEEDARCWQEILPHTGED